MSMLEMVDYFIKKVKDIVQSPMKVGGGVCDLNATTQINELS